MGVSTDGIIFYGFTFSEGYVDEEDYPWIEDDDPYEWRDYWVEQQGYERPEIDWDGYDYNNSDAWPDREKYNRWNKTKKEALEGCHCNISTHCSGDYPMFYVAIDHSIIKAWRGYPKELDTDMGIGLVHLHWNRELKRFCETMGIEWQEPKWYLASYWG